MTRHLLLAGLLFSSSSVALAETADDKPATDESAEASLDDTQEIAGKSSRGRSAAAARSSGRPAASSARPPAGSSRPDASARPPASSSRPDAPSSARPPASSSRPDAPTSARPPASSSRPDAPTSARPPASSSRPAASSANRPPPSSASRPGSSSASHAAVANSSRPVSSPRPAARPAKPTHRVYHANWAPARWAPSYHRYHIHGVSHYSPRYWGAGVFYYNPPPRRHNVVVVNRTVTGEKAGRADTAPTRAVNRDGDIGFGLRGGTYGTEYLGGGGYSDMGVGLTARFRPVEAVGLEVAYEHHSQNFEDDTERVNNPLQASVQVYAFPWTRVSPYATLGLTWNSRSITDSYYNNETFRYDVAQADDTLFGPHAGLGLELALGDSAALNFEGRYINYLNVTPEDVSAPGAVQGTAGLNFYF